MLARLFPTAYPDDEEAAGEFRRFTEGGLRDGKARGAAPIIDHSRRPDCRRSWSDDGLWIDVELDADRRMRWLRSFTDIRLALATRLGSRRATRTTGPRLPTTTRAAHVHDIYEWVGYLQETLVVGAGPR